MNTTPWSDRNDFLQVALKHHNDACLDNHSEENCIAIQYAKILERVVVDGLQYGHFCSDNDCERVCTELINDTWKHGKVLV